MSDDLQILLIGAAAVIDAALLLSLLEKRNLQRVPLPLDILLLGACLFHWSEFTNVLLSEVSDSWARGLRVAVMSAMATGMLLMPCALLHTVLRLWRTGFESQTTLCRRYAVAYLPFLVLPGVIRSIARGETEPFLTRVAPFVSFYVILACTANVAAIVTFWFHRNRTSHPQLRHFLIGTALILSLITALLTILPWHLQGRIADASSTLVLAAILAPLGPTLLFAYYVIRYRLMHLIVERTFVYGSILLAALLFHRTVIEGATDQLQNRFHIDFGILEAVIVLVLVLSYRPFRHRMSESLHYLLGSNVTDVRERTRKIAVEMWKHIDDEPQDCLDWFIETIRNSFEVRQAAIWLFDSSGKIVLCSRNLAEFSDDCAVQLLHRLEPHSFVSTQGGGTLNIQSLELLQQLNGSLAVRVDHANICGLLVLGRRSRAREFREEETNAVVLLAELFGVTLHNHQLQKQRREAEIIAVQHEKLSTVGMLTSCLTHEIKNPLSSIKTIATVLAEQLGPKDPHAEDVRLILAEVDRLATTTGQFLKFARPAERGSGPTAVYPIVDGAVQILSSLARSRGISLET